MSKTYKAGLPFEMELDFEFSADPAEKQTRDYPGSPAVIYIEEIKCAGSVLPMEFFTKEEIKEFEEHCLQRLEQQEIDNAESADCYRADQRRDELLEERIGIANRKHSYESDES